MKKIEYQNGTENMHPAGYICSSDEFSRSTEAKDGSELQVVDEASGKVVNYCIAYNGKWIDR